MLPILHMLLVHLSPSVALSEGALKKRLQLFWNVKEPADEKGCTPGQLALKKSPWKRDCCAA